MHMSYIYFHTRISEDAAQGSLAESIGITVGILMGLVVIVLVFVIGIIYLKSKFLFFLISFYFA